MTFWTVKPFLTAWCSNGDLCVEYVLAKNQETLESIDPGELRAGAPHELGVKTCTVASGIEVVVRKGCRMTHEAGTCLICSRSMHRVWK